MNKVILLCAAGVMALSVTGCNTCCEEPCCPPTPVVVPAPVYGYGPAHHKHHGHKKHHKHHAHHHMKPECAQPPAAPAAPAAPAGK